MWTASCVDEMGEGNINSVTSFVLGWSTANYLATFRSPEQKDKWLSLLHQSGEREGLSKEDSH